jgi:23S rRNA (cytidine1920-2'-O)/16S rRNA (cytidine1409-2'-O)-methyltransferase
VLAIPAVCRIASLAPTTMLDPVQPASVAAYQVTGEYAMLAQGKPGGQPQWHLGVEALANGARRPWRASRRAATIAAMADRTRLDQLLVERGLAPTRSRAQALLLAGRVRVGTGDAARTDRKPGDQVATDVVVGLVQAAPFVSRGGEKLAGALDAFGIEPAGMVCLDVGASTGGFTDCLLRRGASRVYALDVGRGQLAETLRGDARVVSMERTHAGRLDPEHADHMALPEPVDLAVADVSFISLTRLLRGIAGAVRPGGTIVPLVKPQFELSPRQVPRGVVRDPAAREEAVARVEACARASGLEVLGRAPSVLAGPAGNQEVFLHLRRPGGPDRCA